MLTPFKQGWECKGCSVTFSWEAQSFHRRICHQHDNGHISERNAGPFCRECAVDQARPTTEAKT